MLIRTLVTCSFLVAPVIAQEQAPQPAREKKPDPRIQRFFGKHDFFVRKTPAPTSVRSAEPIPSKVCSVPLINVTPSVIPYMPMIKPPANTRSMAIAPPAPPCEDERQDVPMPRKKDSKPAEQGPEAQP